MESLDLTEFMAWKLAQCRSAARKVKGNKFTSPLTVEENTALAIMADCDMKHTVSTDEDGDEVESWEPKYNIYITAENGWIKVREEKPEEELEHGGF